MDSSKPILSIVLTTVTIQYKIIRLVCRAKSQAPPLLSYMKNVVFNTNTIYVGLSVQSVAEEKNIGTIYDIFT